MEPLLGVGRGRTRIVARPKFAHFTTLLSEFLAGRTDHPGSIRIERDPSISLGPVGYADLVSFVLILAPITLRLRIEGASVIGEIYRPAR